MCPSYVPRRFSQSLQNPAFGPAQLRELTSVFVEETAAVSTTIYAFTIADVAEAAGLLEGTGNCARRMPANECD